MNLNDLDKKRYAKRALKESFAVKMNFNGLDKVKTKSMLSKVTSLIKEAKQSATFYRNQTSPSYMKLVFMEQALRDHYAQLASRPSPRIVVENEEVERSQVILAAQDMIDSVQKMYEDINDMMVKELPALVNSIQSEIGANESTDFNDQASQALSALNSALQTAKTELQGALGVVTGQAAPEFDSDDADMDMAAGDLGLGDEGDDLGLGDEGGDLGLGDELDLDDEGTMGTVGRAKR